MGLDQSASSRRVEKRDHKSGRASHVKVVIVGGGVMGCAAALALAERGAEVTILERAVPEASTQADCCAMLSMLNRGEFAQVFNALPDSLSRALATAQRAVELAPSSHLPYFALAMTLFFQKDRNGFRVAAERCIALNPMDGSTKAFLGVLTTASRDSHSTSGHAR